MINGWIDFKQILYSGVFWHAGNPVAGLYSMYAGNHHIGIFTEYWVATNSDARYIDINHVYSIEWRSYGGMRTDIVRGGISCLGSNGNLALTDWYVATMRDAIYMLSNNITLVEWVSYGSLWHIATHYGISCLYGNYGFGTFWDLATYRCNLFRF